MLDAAKRHINLLVNSLPVDAFDLFTRRSRRLTQILQFLICVICVIWGQNWAGRDSEFRNPNLEFKIGWAGG
jgi:hypothetical protein